MRWLFLVRGARDFETNRHRQFLLERRDVTMSGPQLQLRNSALQRARAVLKEHLPEDRGAWAAPGSAVERSVAAEARASAKRAAQISVAFV